MNINKIFLFAIIWIGVNAIAVLIALLYCLFTAFPMSALFFTGSLLVAYVVYRVAVKTIE